MAIIEQRMKRADGWDDDEATSLLVPGVRYLNNDGMKDIVNAAGASLNLSLLLNKYPWWFKNNGGLSLDSPEFRRLRVGGNGTEKKKRRYNEELFDAVAALSRRAPTNYEQLLERHCTAPDDFIYTTFELQASTRLLIGMSALTVFETGITLHPWYGFPYLPASSIKGDLAHYCDDYKGGQDPAIFGTQKRRGQVVFCDAWPLPWNNQPLLFRDIMTSHYPAYYQGTLLPADTDKPNPVNMLAVKEMTKFRFCLRSKNGSQYLLDKTVELLKETLQTVGIGAKTGSSYGYFKEI